jgi:hypothetical protein
VFRAFSRERANLTRSWIKGLGCVSWHTLWSIWQVQLVGYMVEVLGAPIKGVVADHHGGDACDKDAHFGS